MRGFVARVEALDAHDACSDRPLHLVSPSPLHGFHAALAGRVAAEVADPRRHFLAPYSRRLLGAWGVGLVFAASYVREKASGEG